MSSGQSLRLDPKAKAINKKTWYELSLEDEEGETELSPLEARFTSSIRIEEPRSITRSLIEKEVLREDSMPQIPEVPASTFAVDPETHLTEVEAYALEWDQNNEDLGKVDLEWTKEYEVAYREAANSMTEIGDFMNDDVLLGEDIGEDEARKTVDKVTPVCPLPTSRPVLGRPKAKGKRKEPKKDSNKKLKKKEFPPKAQVGPSECQGVASRKLLLLHGHFSPKYLGSSPAVGKPRHNISSGTILPQLVSVSPLKHVGNTESVGKGDPQPPDTDI